MTSSMSPLRHMPADCVLVLRNPQSHAFSFRAALYHCRVLLSADGGPAALTSVQQAKAVFGYRGQCNIGNVIEIVSYLAGWARLDQVDLELNP